jgi:hypothetical protein
MTLLHSTMTSLLVPSKLTANLNPSLNQTMVPLRLLLVSNTMKSSTTPPRTFLLNTTPPGVDIANLLLPSGFKLENTLLDLMLSSLTLMPPSTKLKVLKSVDILLSNSTLLTTRPESITTKVVNTMIS